MTLYRLTRYLHPIPPYPNPSYRPHSTVGSLNPLKVGRGCVLKSNSRLLSGATMGPNSILLEHTLVMAGDTIDAAAVWQVNT